MTTYNTTVTDNSGQTINGSLPIITDSTQFGSADEDGGTADGDETLSASSITITASSGAVSVPANGVVVAGKYGDITISASGAYSYTAGATLAERNALAALPVGGTAIEVVSYIVNDPDFGAATDTLTIQIPVPARPPVVTARLVSDTGKSSGDKITSNASLQGTGAAGATVTITQGGATIGTTTADSAGNWTFTPNLASGKHTLVASETVSGQTGSASLTFTLDKTPPAVTFSGLTVGANGLVTFSGKVTDAFDAASVSVLSSAGKIGSATVNPAAGTWSLSLKVAAGTYAKLLATATDVAGESNSANPRMTLYVSVVGGAYLTKVDTFNAAGLVTGRNVYNADGSLFQQARFTYLTNGDRVGVWSGGTHFQSLPYTSQVITRTASGHLVEEAYRGYTGRSYNAVTIFFDAAQKQASETFDYTNGSHFTRGLESGAVLTAAFNDTMNGVDASETFLFNRGYGHAIVTDFGKHLTGATHDWISVAASEFAGFSALMSHTQTVGANSVITGLSGDQITLDGVTKAQLLTLSADFKFHA